MTEIRREAFDPAGRTVTLGDIEDLAARARQLGYARECAIEFRTPLAGNRRAVKISVVEDDGIEQPVGQLTPIAAQPHSQKESQQWART